MLVMEQEVFGLLKAGSGLVLGASFIIILLWWRESRHFAFAWLTGFLIFLSIGIYLWLGVIGPKEVPGSMLSEENSLGIGWAGITWVISMACMLKGISLLKPEKRKKP